MTEQDYTEWSLKLQQLTADQNLAAHVTVHHLLNDDVALAKQRAEQFAELGRQIDAHIKAYKRRGGSND